MWSEIQGITEERQLSVAAQIIAIQFAENGKVAVPMKAAQGGTGARAEYDKKLCKLTRFLMPTQSFNLLIFPECQITCLKNIAAYQQNILRS